MIARYFSVYCTNVGHVWSEREKKRQKQKNNARRINEKRVDDEGNKNKRREENKSAQMKNELQFQNYHLLLDFHLKFGEYETHSVPHAVRPLVFLSLIPFARCRSPKRKIDTVRRIVLIWPAAQISCRFINFAFVWWQMLSGGCFLSLCLCQAVGDRSQAFGRWKYPRHKQCAESF